jgi:hypothetical protein
VGKTITYKVTLLFQPYDLTGSFKGYLFVKSIIPHKYDYFNSFRHLLIILKSNMEEENEESHTVYNKIAGISKCLTYPI